MNSNPVDVWNQLEQSRKGDGVVDVVSRSAKVETGYGSARFALGPLGEPRLLVPCAKGTSGQSLQDGPKLAVMVANYNADTGQQLFIDVLCIDIRLNAVFAELCKEILKRLSEGEGPVTAVSGTIGDFRELLLANATDSVSRSKTAGLLGELYALRMLVEHSPEAAAAWKGPYDQRHDFRRANHAIEVKTSTRSDATKISVHGADQLLEPLHGKLALFHIRMEIADQGRLSVEALFDELVHRGVDPMILRTGLAEIGCADPKDSAWNRYRFEVQGFDAFAVGSDFPRITSKDFPGDRVPQAISRLTYELDLSAAGDFRADDGYVNGFIEEMFQ